MWGRVDGWVVCFFQAEDGIRDYDVTGVQTCALPISPGTMLVDGEGDRGRNTIYWQLMEEGLLDAIQPDTLHMGLWFYHVLARDIDDSGHATLIAPHNYNAAYLGLRANIQFGAVTERFVIAEDSTLNFELYRGDEYVFEDGKYAVPTSPGLAVSIDRDL